MKTFGAARPVPPQRSNTEIARDFLDLSFRLESGAELPVLTRFEGPVTVSLAGRITPIFDRELDKLIGRLQREAGLQISRIPDNSVASIRVEAITRAEINRVVPSAACFVLPQGLTWDEFRRNTRNANLNWTNLKTRSSATVFVPADISPQEVRDCLHEEISQALGPVNDLYRLEDSIYNDDNMHSVLTGFDMLILRVTYSDRLRSGMTREEAAAEVPRILASLNPAGSRYTTRPYQPSPRAWVEAMETALSQSRQGPRRQASFRALQIAQDEGWTDTRLGLSLLTTGRAAAPRDGALALESFLKAAEVYDSRPATAIHSANVGIQIAAFALAAGEYETTLRIADRHIPVVIRAENAALLADYLLAKAAAYDALGLTAEANAARLDGFAWGRYGLRSDQEVLQRDAEIRALTSAPLEGA